MAHNSPTTLRPNPSGDWPEVHPEAYLDPTAQLIGRVRIGPGVFVGPGAGIRADEPDADGEVQAITVAAECNIQDGAIIHALAGTRVTIGPRTSLSHGAILHGPCSIGKRCFVGFGAVVFRAEVGEGVFIGPRAVVEGVDVPADTSIPAATCPSQDELAQLRNTDPSEREFMEKVVQANLKLAEGYRNAANSAALRPAKRSGRRDQASAQ